MEIINVEGNYTGKEHVYGKVDYFMGGAGVVILTPAFLVGEPILTSLLVTVFALGSLGIYTRKAMELLLRSQAMYFIHERGGYSDRYLKEERKVWANRNPMGISFWKLIPAVFGKSVSFNRDSIKNNEQYVKEMDYFYRSRDIKDKIAKGEWEVVIKGRNVKVFSKKTLTPLELWDKARANALKI